MTALRRLICQWRISRAADAGAPLPPSVIRFMAGDAPTRAFYEQTRAMARQLHTDAEAMSHTPMTRPVAVAPKPNEARPHHAPAPAAAHRPITTDPMTRPLIHWPRAIGLSLAAAASIALLLSLAVYLRTRPDSPTPIIAAHGQDARRGGLGRMPFDPSPLAFAATFDQPMRSEMQRVKQDGESLANLMLSPAPRAWGQAPAEETRP